MAETDADTELVWLPEQGQEDALHANRLLPVEERPFQRLAKALLGKDSLVLPFSDVMLTPPPEDGSDAAETIAYTVPSAAQLQKFHEDVLLDFAALDSSIVRIQLIKSSNERERQRYAAAKAKILETAQAVRDNTAQLRVQLLEAQRVLEQRKGYDALAAKILDDKNLRSRDDSQAEIEKLQKEIADLEGESAECEATWLQRREQFDRVAAEGEAMVRLIKGIKDEVEADTEADDDAEKDDEHMEDGDEADDRVKLGNSRLGTPAVDAGSPRAADAGDATPMPEGGEAGGATPARPANKFLDVDDSTRVNSRVGSPLSQAVDVSEDVDMAEAVTPVAYPDGSDADVAKAGEGRATVAGRALDMLGNGETMDDT